ncbi:hypothetical protein BC629DRAFT_942484 [Irpex lacteus]|nr:hypothetical protein BC629DRAFT_942484 [Irpex lacteus]
MTLRYDRSHCASRFECLPLLSCGVYILPYHTSSLISRRFYTPPSTAELAHHASMSR